MVRPDCTHPCHLDPSVPAVSDFMWTCPRCKRMVAIVVTPFVDPTPVLVTP